jgi:hypothetical protein
MLPMLSSDPASLGDAGNKAQDFWQAAQHSHLAFARGCVVLFAAFEFFQKGDETVLLAVHLEAAQFRELDGFTCRHEYGHGIAGFATGFECRQHSLHMFFDEQHVGDDDIGGGNVSFAGFKC